MNDKLARQFAVALLEGFVRLVGEVAATGALDRAALTRIDRALTRTLDDPRFAAEDLASAWVHMATTGLAEIAAALPPRR